MSLNYNKWLAVLVVSLTLSEIISIYGPFGVFPKRSIWHIRLNTSNSVILLGDQPLGVPPYESLPDWPRPSIPMPLIPLPPHTSAPLHFHYPIHNLLGSSLSSNRLPTCTLGHPLFVVSGVYSQDIAPTNVSNAILFMWWMALLLLMMTILMCVKIINMMALKLFMVMKVSMSLVFYSGFFTLPKLPHPTQRHAIFHVRCTINKKVCNVIIDSGSSDNIVSRTFVKALGLSSEPHPNPYQIRWIRKGVHFTVQHLCRVPLSTGKHYSDEVVCDVLDMDACHVLLDRPWQFDVTAIHNGKENSYSFMWHGVKLTLMSLVTFSSPSPASHQPADL